MYYYLYQITNNLNGKIYVGVHKTKNINDGYMGSGVTICNAIKKYGLANFEKVILETFENAKAMYAREKEIVTEEFLSRGNVYNLRCGGHGGFDHINKIKDENYIKVRKENGKKFNWKTRNNSQIIPKYGSDNWAFGKQTKTNFRLNSELQKRAQVNSLSDSACKKRQETMKKNKHSQKEKNSQYGTMWITNSFVNKKIKKVDTVPIGWKKGRVNGNKSFKT